MADVDDRWTSPGPDGKRVRNDRWGRGNRWQARWREDGRQRAATYPTKAEAQAHLDAVRADTAAGRDRAKADATVGDYAARWLPTAGTSESARVWYADVVRLYIVPRWGRTPVRQVTTAAVREWLRDLEQTPATRSTKGGGRAPKLVIDDEGEPIRDDKGEPVPVMLSAARCRGILATLSAIMAHAVDDRAVDGNPVSGVRRPRVPTSAGRGLTPAELHRLLDALQAQHESAWIAGLILGYTGVRWGELVDLDPSDWTGSSFRVEGGSPEVNGRIVRGDTKSHQTREVGAPPFLVPIVDAWLAGRRDGPLVPGPKGGRYRQSTWRRHWTRALADAELSDVKPHDLRHTALSLAIIGGADIRAVQGMAGHAKASTTMDIYSHLLPGGVGEVAARLDQFAPPSGARLQVVGAQDVRRGRSVRAGKGA